MRIARFGLFATTLACFANPSGAAAPIRPAVLGEPLPAITLPALQGSEVSLAAFKGKNVVVVFPRVQYGEGRWCTICNYGYAELAALDTAEAFRRELDAEVIFIVPFGRQIAERWIDATPAELAKVQSWKSPKEDTEKTKALAARARRHLPLDLPPGEGRPPLPFPILLDADRTVTGGLGLFRTEWSGAKADQLVPSVFVLDREGVVRYKHVAQESTWDRPTGREIVDVVRAVDHGSAKTDPTRQAIDRAARDYVEGWYEGSAERMRRALHPELAKRKVVEGEGGTTLRSLTAAALIDNVKPRPLQPGQRVTVEILDIHGPLATVKITSPLFVDYAHMALWNGEWKVLNVAWEESRRPAARISPCASCAPGRQPRADKTGAWDRE